jgi:hypothetical protein
MEFSGDMKLCLKLDVPIIIAIIFSSIGYTGGIL